MITPETPHSTTQRFYGRRKGRPLHKRKSMLWESALPRFQIDLPADDVLDPAALFTKDTSEIWLEIGFGGGEHVAEQAARHPDIGFIGCEPFMNGIASLLDHIDRRALANIRIFPDDARHLLDKLPDQSLARCFILFADPWPKARHAERRFVSPENLARLARVMKAGAMLSLATDHAALGDWIAARFADAAHDFIKRADSTIPPTDWVATRYEQKAAAAGRGSRYFNYTRSKQAL